MSEYMFGSGRGHLSARAAKAARSEGAILVNYTDSGCRCGYNCSHTDCPQSRRHWFSGANRGAPFDAELESRVMAAVRAAATKRDQKLLGGELCPEQEGTDELPDEVG